MTTTTTLTLTAFLEQRIAERALAATAAMLYANGTHDEDEDKGKSWYADAEYVLTARRGVVMASEDIPDPSGVLAHIALNDPARVLAECKAHRAIVAAVWEYEHTIDGEWGPSRTVEQLQAEAKVMPDALRALAAIWADHEAYDESWAL